MNESDDYPYQRLSPTVMSLPSEGFLLIVKRDCPTCQLITAVAETLSARGLLADLMSQDDPAFPDGMTVTDDRALRRSFELGIEIVPTLIKCEGGKEIGRVIGWHRGEWQHLTGVNDLGVNLPNERPGCGSLSVSPGMEEELQSRYGHTGLKSRIVGVAYPDDEAEQMFERGWTDGLPVVPPTETRVLRMLQGTTRSADEVLGNAPPSLSPCTVEKAAINAVMAGCKPAYFPVVLASLDAALDPRYNWYGLSSTTMGAGPVVVVNGPIARRIGMNWGFNALGHGNRANATIARAVQLVGSNVGGSKPGGVDRSTIGHPGKFGVCFAEDETDETWEPLSVAQGLPRGQSAVTIFGSVGSTVCFDQLSRDADSLSRSLALSLQSVGHPKLVGWPTALVVMAPEHWAVFKRAGWSRTDIDSAIRQAGKRPASELVQGAGGVGEGVAPQAAIGDIAKIEPGNLLLVRAGSHAGLTSTILAGWEPGEQGSVPTTKEVTA